MLSHAGESVNRCGSVSRLYILKYKARVQVPRSLTLASSKPTSVRGNWNRFMSDYIEASLQIILNDPNKI